MKNNFSLIFLLSVLFFNLNCGNWWDLMVGGDKEFVIVGTREIKNETLVFPPGTRVIFKTKYTPSIAGGSWSPGQLVIGEGATLIAEGTSEEPVLFNGDTMTMSGRLIFRENSENNNVIKYCKFDKSFVVECNNSVLITKCKFISSRIEVYKGNFIINNNDFDLYDSPSPVIWGWNNSFKLIIKSNNIKNSKREGIGIGNIQAIIEYNNIVNCNSYAVENAYSNLKLIKENYIVNCNEMVGIDTNGNQCRNVIFSNYYREQPVPNAGCGW